MSRPPIAALLALLWVGLVVLAATAPVIAAEANATAAPVIGTGDPRSDGAGPGLVGSPLMIALGVAVLGLGTVLVTVVVARLARRS